MGDEPPTLPPKEHIYLKYSQEDQEKAIRDEALFMAQKKREKQNRSLSFSTSKMDIDKNNGSFRPRSALPLPKQRTIFPRPSKSTSDVVSTISKSAQPPKAEETDNLMLFTSPEKPKENKDAMFDHIQNINKSQISTHSNLNSLGKVPVSSSISAPLTLNIPNVGQASIKFHGNNNNNNHQKTFIRDEGLSRYSLKNLHLDRSYQSNSLSLDSSKKVEKDPMAFLSDYINPKTTKPQGSLLVYTDLIDLGSDCVASQKSSKLTNILEDFDPLSKKEESINNQAAMPQSALEPISVEATELFSYKSANRDSYYDQVDPFEYMQASAGSTRSDPVIDIYDGLGSPGAFSGECFDIPPPLPPRHADEQDESAVSTVSEEPLDENSDGILRIRLRKLPTLSVDDEAHAFWKMIKILRYEYRYDDVIGNPGLLHSPCLESNTDLYLSVKLIIFHLNLDPAVFTCNLSTSVEHVVMQSMVALELNGDYKDYVLKVRGVDEYLCGQSILADYEYVHSCVKHDKDVAFTLVQVNEAKKSYQRTAEDDEAINKVEIGIFLTGGSKDAAHYSRLSIAVEAFEREVSKIKQSGYQLIEGTPVQDLSFPMRSKPLRGIVRQICTLLGEWETIELCDSLIFFINTCRTIQKSQGILDGEDDYTGQHRMLCTGSSEDFIPYEKLKETLNRSLNNIVSATHKYLCMYKRAFRVDLEVAELQTKPEEPVKEAHSVFSKVNIQIQGLHRMDKNCLYDFYFVETQLYHGVSCVGVPALSKSVKEIEDKRFYPRIVFSEWLELGMRVSGLPRESRLVFTIFGLKILPSENKQELPQYSREPLGWAALQMFSFDGWLSQGNYMLTLWPMENDKRLPPAPYSYDHPNANECPLLTVHITDLPFKVFSPNVVPQTPNLLEFNDLDISSQHQLLDIIERDIFTFTDKTSVEEKEILWEKRHYLHKEPSALAMVLLATRSWDSCVLPDLHSLVLHWSPPRTSSDALHLLLPCFPDTIVRNKAVEWLRSVGSDELIVYLPQLVQAVKHETWDVSNLICFLLERALSSPRLAHHLYWLLNQCLPLQTNMSGVEAVLTDTRYKRRLNLITRTLLSICGKNMEGRLLRQEALLRSLYETALSIKSEKDFQRLKVLRRDLRLIHENLQECPTSLPISPSFEVAGIDVEACSYYTSFTIPLRLVFLSSEVEAHQIHSIFKVGDDLRQDMLVIQMIRLMDKLWLKEGLDLKIVTFNVVPTGDRIGILEMVRDAETLGKIHTEHGLTGPFKDRIIAEWLAKQNPSQLEYHRAVANFTASCAGYCVATYILGICDRHNDNIMLKTSGHMFHIDFGKFLGDAQKFANFKRDRTPFVLTDDMAYVINGGEKPSDKFQSFVDLCCDAFNIIRSNGHLLLYLFALMASSGIPGVTKIAVDYVEKALLQDKTNAEAGAHFAKMIKESLHSWFTQVNFFIHNLAQLRFSGESQDHECLLSFVPHTYSMVDDGRISRVRLFNYQKRYDPEKYYVYILKVTRTGQKEPTYMFRSYREFSELHQKLCYLYPLAPLHSLPKGNKLGRSEVKAVAEKRKDDIERFLKSLFCLADEIAHSNLVYTFFHPLLRDQEDSNIHKQKLKDTKSTSDGALNNTNAQGQVKVSFQYARRELQIMVHHARNLSTTSSSEPSPYVKLYLLPDPDKRTKRKTKVIKKSCHPTYMEMITYRMGLDVIYSKVLEISVWSEDVFSENIYLGSAYLKLSDYDCRKESSEWLSLEHSNKTARNRMLMYTGRS